VRSASLLPCCGIAPCPQTPSAQSRARVIAERHANALRERADVDALRSQKVKLKNLGVRLAEMKRHEYRGRPMSLTLQRRLTRRLDQRRGACALIAIKERSRCKTRLSAALGATARLQLVRSMLAAVLSAAGGARTVAQIIVVSPERDTVPADLAVLADSGEGLNGALMQAHRMLRNFDCTEVVILPADLPNVTAAEIDGLVHAGRRGGFAIAPDAAGVGTNALCLASPHPFRFQFGVDSRRLHLEEAERTGLSSEVIRLPGLEFDVDWPDDLHQLEEQQWLARHRA
jgi:2-phospho-L-lactate guanylyltransferase